MKHFWQLYRKDMRFLMGPGIALMVLPLFDWLYVPDVLRMFAPHYSINDSLSYFYAVLFLYACINGHTTGSRVQLLSLPTRRWLHLAAPFAATVTWAALSPLFALGLHLLKQMYSMLRYHTLLPKYQWGDPKVFLPGAVLMVTWPLLFCGIAALAYAAAIAVKKYSYMTGVTVFVAGSILSPKLIELVWHYVHIYFPSSSSVRLSLFSINLWGGILTQGVLAAAMFLIAAIIYEQFSEA